MKYKATLNLPRTKFPMRGNLPEKEPKIIEFWQREKVFRRLMPSENEEPLFRLHDNPVPIWDPFDSGKYADRILKDTAIRYKRIMGNVIYSEPFWFAHGLRKKALTLDPSEYTSPVWDLFSFRAQNRKSARAMAHSLEDPVIRTGAFPYYDQVHYTFDPDYEAAVLKAFQIMVKNGMVYRGMKPDTVCTYCGGALDSSEAVYRKQKTRKIIFSFPLCDRKKVFPSYHHPVSIISQTESPWELPGVAAVALHHDESYCLVSTGKEGFIIAETLLGRVMEKLKISEYKVLHDFEGSFLTDREVCHPLSGKRISIIFEKYVSVEEGTGSIHIASGLGRRDFESALEYSLPIVIPIDQSGRYNDSLNELKGKEWLEGDRAVEALLKSRNRLLYSSNSEAERPHCLRCARPVFTLAMAHWFAAIDINHIRIRTLDEIERMKWYPPGIEERLLSTLRYRPDLLLSRRKTWGVPIPILVCTKCGARILDVDVIENVIKVVKKEGSESWFTGDITRFLPSYFHCEQCGETSFRKGTEVFDDAFVSGCSILVEAYKWQKFHHLSDLAVLGTEDVTKWLTICLLTSVMTRDRAPFGECLIHGRIIKERESSSEGDNPEEVNGITDIISRYGADPARLFTAYGLDKGDVRLSKENVERVLMIYRKFRYNLRFMLGNLFDYNPETDHVSDSNLRPEDRWVLHKKEIMLADVCREYERYAFHRAVKILFDFVSEDLSALYFEWTRDRLYSSLPGDKSRRSAQRVYFEILRDLLTVISPILPFTAEEAWQSYEPFTEISGSVVLSEIPPERKIYINHAAEAIWEIMLEVRKEIYSIIEDKRAGGIVRGVNSSYVRVWSSGRIFDILKGAGEVFENLLLVPRFELLDYENKDESESVESEGYPGTAYQILPFEGETCPRCRKDYDNLTPEGICSRCSAVLEQTAE